MCLKGEYKRYLKEWFLSSTKNLLLVHSKLRMSKYYLPDKVIYVLSNQTQVWLVQYLSQELKHN